MPNRGFIWGVNILRSFSQLGSASAVPHVQRSFLFSTISTSSLSLPRFYSTGIIWFEVIVG
ncbi:hypothetical protein SLEP1_g33054 [Rubroshorea leprosula]|uniref:Uncharacterized protein n=1 Tax=Rubroshorea leprosula TaxID=152421 RepID=A0AAV5KFF0_9ROSI|nr:hypothetical protein SLEP1_g33054 [Rubroshorea leprosula]